MDDSIFSRILESIQNSLNQVVQQGLSIDLSKPPASGHGGISSEPVGDITDSGDAVALPSRRKGKSKSKRAVHPESENDTGTWPGNLRTFQNAMMGMKAWNNPDSNKDMMTYGKELQEKEVNRGNQNIENYGRRIQGTGQIIQGLQNKSELSGAGDVVGGMGTLAGQFGPVGKTVEVFAKLTDTVLKTMDGFKQWNTQLMESNFRFAEYSGTMAQVQAEHEVRQIQLERERGDRRSGPASYQSREADRFARNVSGIEDIYGNFTSLLSGGVTNIANMLLEITLISHITQRIAEMMNVGGEGAKEGENMTEWMDRETQNQSWYEQYGRPERFR